MTTEPMTLSPDDDLQEAVEIMIDEKIGGIPVVDEAGGTGGYRDLRRCFALFLEPIAGRVID